MITGKSGSGKSTLLNVASGLDNPSSGVVKIFDKDINDKKEKYLSYLHREYISFLHQDYLLILEESVIYNITLPLLIKGENKEHAFSKAKEYLKKLGFENEFANRICKDLSGGEKQRVALLRSFISGPKIIFMDEPTGALDSKNKIQIMEMIKKISRSVLIIFVTHDKYLVDKYADRVITLKDGEIASDTILNNGRDVLVHILNKFRTPKGQFEKLEVRNNLKKKFKRNILRFVSLIFSFTSLLLVLGFNYGASEAIKKQCNNILDIGVSSISKQESKIQSDSNISLVKTSRPSEEEIHNYLYQRNYYTVLVDYSYLLSNVTKCEIEAKSIKNTAISPIFNFTEDYIDISLLGSGYLPRNENEVLVNNLFYNHFLKENNISPIGKYILIKWQKECVYRVNKDEYILDYFILERSFKISGVVNEITFMNNQKVYFSYQWLDSYLSSVYLNNLSTYLNRDYSWKERVINAPNNDEITSYSRYLFLNDLSKIDEVSKDVSGNSAMALSNLSLSIKSTVLDIVEAIKVGLILFIVMIFVGVIILLIISSFSNYLQDKRKVGICLSLGSTSEQIENIYLSENIIISFISLIVSLGLGYLFSLLINTTLNNLFGVSSIITIPIFMLNTNIVLVPTLLIIGLLFISLVTTLIPIKFAQKASIKDEIKNND